MLPKGRVCVMWSLPLDYRLNRFIPIIQCRIAIILNHDDNHKKTSVC